MQQTPPPSAPTKSYTDVRNIYKLRDWIRESDLVLEYICMNPCEGAVNVFRHLTDKFFQESYLKYIKHFGKIHPFSNICHNPAEWARDFILNHPEYLNYYNLSQKSGEWVG